MQSALLAVATSLGVLVGATASAQKLPPPSRTVYKCDEGGKVVYSDSPCLGAQRVDVEPTRGVNQLSGSKRTGADVRHEQHNEAMAKALQPVFNETAEQRAMRHRRAKLAPEARLKCSALDNQLSTTEGEERRASESDRHTVQSRLLALRKQHQALRC